MGGRPLITISDFPAKASTLTVAEIVSLARRVEEDGLDRFAVTDWPYYFDCIAVVSACLAGTQRIAVESLVTNPYIRHPETTACAFATLQEYSGGRAILGIGAGVEDPSSVWVPPWGHARPRPITAVRELVDLCRDMWEGRPSPDGGRVLHGSGLALKFPVPGGVPVLIAGRGPRMLELAGELADIVHIAAPFLGERYIRDCIGHVRSGAARSDRSDHQYETDLTVSLAVHKEGRHARELAKTITAYGIIWMAGTERYASRRPNWPVPSELEVDDRLVEMLSATWNMWSGEPLPTSCVEMIDDDVLDQFSVAGDPAECREKLMALVRRHPDVTGLRLKLPPLTGPQSGPDYLDMIDGVAEAVDGW